MHHDRWTTRGPRPRRKNAKIDRANATRANTERAKVVMECSTSSTAARAETLKSKATTTKAAIHRVALIMTVRANTAPPSILPQKVRAPAPSPLSTHQGHSRSKNTQTKDVMVTATLYMAVSPLSAIHVSPSSVSPSSVSLSQDEPSSTASTKARAASHFPPLRAAHHHGGLDTRPSLLLRMGARAPSVRGSRNCHLAVETKARTIPLSPPLSHPASPSLFPQIAPCQGHLRARPRSMDGLPSSYAQVLTRQPLHRRETISNCTFTITEDVGATVGRSPPQQRTQLNNNKIHQALLPQAHLTRGAVISLLTGRTGGGGVTRG